MMLDFCCLNWARALTRFIWSYQKIQNQQTICVVLLHDNRVCFRHWSWRLNLQHTTPARDWASSDTYTGMGIVHNQWCNMSTTGSWCCTKNYRFSSEIEADTKQKIQKNKTILEYSWFRKKLYILHGGMPSNEHNGLRLVIFILHGFTTTSFFCACIIIIIIVPVNVDTWFAVLYYSDEFVNWCLAHLLVAHFNGSFDHYSGSLRTFFYLFTHTSFNPLLLPHSFTYYSCCYRPLFNLIKHICGLVWWLKFCTEHFCHSST